MGTREDQRLRAEKAEIERDEWKMRARHFQREDAERESFVAALLRTIDTMHKETCLIRPLGRPLKDCDCRNVRELRVILDAYAPGWRERK